LLRRHGRLLVACAWIILACDAALLSRPGNVYKDQQYSLAVGRALKAAPGELWGAWDCGIVGYYSDCGVMNLDGLTNNDIYPLLLRGHASLYPRQRGINRILNGDLGDKDWTAQRGLVTPIAGPLLRRVDDGSGGAGWPVWAPPPAGRAH